MDGHFRSLVYMRPLSIWGMQSALSAPKAILDAPGVNVMDRIYTPPLSSRTSFNYKGTKKKAHKAKCFSNSMFHWAC